MKKEEKEIKEKKRRGDRKDAWLVRGLDSMHYIMPYNLPKRTDNEAVLTETIDLTAIEEYIKKKNVDNVSMSVLSMGMTGDYEVAVEEGATMIRVGTGIFGAR